MEVKLYYVPPSFFSIKALLCLEEKGVKFKPMWVHLHEGETYKPWYMKMNPLGQVPVLVHGENIISNTPAIAKYLDEKFDGCLLMPDVSSTVGAKVKEIEDLFVKIEIETITFGYMKHADLRQDSHLPEFLLQLVEKRKSNQGFTEGTENKTYKKFTKLAEENPELKDAYLYKREQIMKRSSSLTKEAISVQLENAIKTFDAVERMLQQNEEEGNADHWLCGPDLTVADIDLVILFKRVEWVGAAKATFRNGNYTHLDKYYQRLLQRPSVVKHVVNTYKLPGMIKYLLWAKGTYIERPLRLLALTSVAVVGLGIWAYTKYSSK